jgi:hypothetical protein
MNVLRSFAFIAVLSLSVSTSAFATQKITNTKAAKSAADSWLTLLDTGEFASAWENASDLLRAKQKEAAWKDETTKGRASLGKLLKRRFRLKQIESALQGVPDGHYVIFQYTSTFENKADATETVTPHLDKDGQWRVSAYTIK